MIPGQIALTTLLLQGKKVIDSTWWTEVENQHIKVKVKKIGNGYVLDVIPKDEIGEIIKETWQNLCESTDEEQKENYKAILRDLILNF